MRIFKTRVFARFAARNAISDAALRLAVHRAEAGLADADLRDVLASQELIEANHDA